jgi:hypothetical protein
VYVPLPQVANDFTGNVFKLIVDRLLPRYLRNVFYAYVCRELAAAAAEDQARSTFDAVGLLREIEETAGGALDQIFFGVEFTLTEAEEYGGIVKDAQDELIEAEAEAAAHEDEGPEFVDHDAEEEAEATEETEEIQEEEPEEVKIDERRAPLMSFINNRLTDESSTAGETVREAVLVSLTDGFVEGRHILEKATSPREEIMGLIKMISLYYDGVIIMVDLIDPWPYLSEQEKINLLGDLYNVELAGAGKLKVVVVSDQGNFDDFDAGFKNRCRMLPLELKLTSEKTVDFGDDAAKAEAFVGSFLNSARLTEAAGIEPFDAPAIAGIMKQAGGSALAAMEIFGKTLDEKASNA